MLYFISFFFGFGVATALICKSDDWRVIKLKQSGYDAAVRDITKFGYYFNEENIKIPIKVLQVEGKDEHED